MDLVDRELTMMRLLRKIAGDRRRWLKTIDHGRLGRKSTNQISPLEIRLSVASSDTKRSSVLLKYISHFTHEWYRKEIIIIEGAVAKHNKIQIMLQVEPC